MNSHVAKWTIAKNDQAAKPVFPTGVALMAMEARIANEDDYR
jgi:hypothetical protein